MNRILDSEKATKVTIIEVGPRDGLQNEKKIISTKDKLIFIEKLIDAGVVSLEPTSFVNPKNIPQMGDSQELYRQLSKQCDCENLHLSCLVPNIRGFELAKEVGVKEIAVFSAISNSFSQKNVNATISESLQRLEKVTVAAQKENMRIRGYVSTVFGCPYEGKVSDEVLLEVCEKLISFGCYEISLGDTIGVATPGEVYRIMRLLKQYFDKEQLALHFHDTRGMAMANVMAAYDEGASKFDSSAGGLGGCPYAKGATGNVATEDLVYAFNSIGVKTGIKLEKLLEASQFMLNLLEKKSASKLVQVLLNKEFHCGL